MSNRNAKDRDNSGLRFPKLVNNQADRAVTPQIHHRNLRVLKQGETAGQYSTRDPLLGHISETTRYDDFARNTVDQSRDHSLRPLSRVGRQIQRTREEDLRRRDKERLDAIVGRDTRAFNFQPSTSDSLSDTSLLKAQPRSFHILQELEKDGFFNTTLRHGGVAFDVSLGGRPARLSPIGSSDRRLVRNGCNKKRKKSNHQKHGAKRKKREQKRKRRRRRKMNDNSDSDDGKKRLSPVEKNENEQDEDKEEDWEDVEEEEEE